MWPRWIVFVLSLCGLTITILAARPFFIYTKGHVISTDSLQRMREDKVPSEIIKQIETSLLGKRFSHTSDLNSRLVQILGDTKTKEVRKAIFRATTLPITPKDFAVSGILALVGLGICVFAFTRPMKGEVSPPTFRFLIGKARRMAGQATAETDLAVAANVKVLEEEARTLRVDAGKHRILGQFDAAYRNYKRAYELYVKLGDKDAQCNVLCSLAETTPRREEMGGYVERIEAVCASILDADEKAKALRNLDALKQRLKQSRGWPY